MWCAFGNLAGAIATVLVTLQAFTAPLLFVPWGLLVLPEPRARR